jgi:hypothetical protein
VSRRSVSTSVAARVPVARDALFDAFIEVDLEQILLGYGPIPAVTSTSGQTGPWDHVGSSRTVNLADGSTAREEVTECVTPQLFGYRVAEFTNPVRFFAREARGRWIFNEAGPHATDVTWTYAFTARSTPAAFALLPVVKLAWRGFMRSGLEELGRLAQAEGGRPAASPGPPRGSG